MENIQVKKENSQVIVDLIEVNKHRIKGYSTAISSLDNTKDSDLISVFETYIQQAQQFKSQLIPLVYREGEEEDVTDRVENTLGSWPEELNARGYGYREAVVVACEKEERENEKIYRIALENMEDVEERISDMVRSQAELQVAAREQLTHLLAKR